MDTPFHSTNANIRKTLGRYQLLAMLGEGGMGKVYRAWDQNLKREVALKTLIIASDQSDDKNIERFFREASAIANLQHPNIVKLYENGCEENIYYFTMDYIKGKSLLDIIKEQEADYKQIAIWMEKIARAVHYSHQQGFIHRDLKPANILISEQNEPFVTDFGLAKSHKVEKRLTQTGMVIGTPAYMSPEQAQGKNRLVNKKSDVYSLGATLYSMLTKQAPFSGTSTMHILIQVVEKLPILPRKLAPRIPRPLEAICLKAMEKNPRHRYRDAEKIAEDIKAYLEGKKIQAPQIGLVYKIRRNSLFYLSIFFILMAIAIFFIIWPNFSSSKADDSKIHKLKVEMSAKDYLLSAQRSIDFKLFEVAKENLELALQHGKEKFPELVPQIRGEFVVVFVGLKEYDKALQVYKNIPLQQLTDRVHLAVAKIYYFQSEKEMFYKVIKQIDLDKASPKTRAEALFYIGQTYYQNKNYQQAKDYFNHSNKLIEKHKLKIVYKATLPFYIGVCHYHMKQIAQSLHHLKMAQSLSDPKQVYFYLAKCYLQNQQYNKAFVYIIKCLKIDENNSEFHSLHGKVLARLQQYIQASKAFTRALDLNYTNLDALDEIVVLGSKDITTQKDLFDLIIYFIFKWAYNTPIDPLLKKVKAIERLYQNNYKEVLQVQYRQGTIIPFLKTLQTPNKDNQLYHSATQGLMALRYNKNLDQQIKQTLANLQDFHAKKRIKRVWQNIRQKRKRERNFVVYYHMARLYLKKDANSQQQLEKPIYKKNLERILHNKKENILHRYLAAKSLLALAELALIDQKLQDRDKIVALICSEVLREIGLYRDFSFANLTAPSLLQVIAIRNRFLAFHGLAYSKELLLKVREEIKYLSQYLKSKNEVVKIYAAAALYNRLIFLNMSDFQTPQNILIAALANRREDIRSLAYFALLQSISVLKVKKTAGFYKLEKLLKKGLYDTPAIQMILLTAAGFYNLKTWQDDLIHLIQNSKNRVTRLGAIYTLSQINSEAPFVQKIVFNPKSPPIQRLIAFYGPHLLAMSTQETLPHILKMINKIGPLSNDPDIRFTATIYGVGAALDYPFLRHIDKKQNPLIKAQILVGLRIPPYPGAKLLPIPRRVTTIDKRKIVKKFLTHHHTTVRQAAIISYIVIARERECPKIYQSLQKNRLSKDRQAAALGFYQRIYFSLINIHNQHFANIGSSTETMYSHHLDRLQKTKDLFQRHRTWLSWAIKLHPQAKYYFERSLLYMMQGKYHNALKDIELARHYSPDYTRYIVQQLRILRKLGKNQEALELTNHVSDYKIEMPIALLGKFFLKAGKAQKAQRVFAKLLLNSQNHINGYEGLALSYYLMGEKRKAWRYYKYLYTLYPDIEQKIQTLQDVENLTDHPWLKKFE